MATRSRRPKKPTRTDVDLAIVAVENTGRPLDLDAGDPDTSPTALGLRQKAGRESCARCRRHAGDTCPECGSLLCENCVTGEEG